MVATHTLLMTGATRGIGRAAATNILVGDPDVHLVVVTRGDSCQSLARELAQDKYSVSSVSADLDSMSSIRKAAEKIRTKLESGALPPLHGFVGNAGIQHTNALIKTPDGYEATFTVNVLANHLFVRTLQPHFELGSRITITVSDTHFGDFKHNLGMVPGPVWQDPAKLAATGAFENPTTITAGRTAYSTSKLAAIYHVHELARRIEGVDVVSFNPGFVPGTGLARNADPVSRFMMARVLPLLTLTPMASNRKDAGRDLANVVLGKTWAPNGAYVDRTKIARSSDESYNAKREDDLWRVIEKLSQIDTHAGSGC